MSYLPDSYKVRSGPGVSVFRFQDVCRRSNLIRFVLVLILGFVKQNFVEIEGRVRVRRRRW
jgi:hypothetical protein